MGFLTEAIADLERDWLGVARPAPAAVLAESGWSPDRPAPPGVDFCPKCGGSVGAGEYRASPAPAGCRECRARRFPWNEVVRLGAYRDPLRGWVHAIKFTKWDAMGRALGRRLGESVREAQLANANAPAKNSEAVGAPRAAIDLVIPMPSTWRRRARRGVDHAAVIASGVARELDAPVCQALQRLARPPQWTVPPSRRRDNVRRSIRPRRIAASLVRDARLVLVDDVTTSRSTLIEAARVLRALGAASITVAILAAADPPGRRARTTSPGNPER
ncbi:MAG: ComF family protein [Phycisphaerales bacterium]